MRLLLLDDHRIFGESLSLLLEDQEEVDSCDYVSNIDDFINILKNKTYDILLIDINLKDKRTGLDVIKEVRKLYPDKKIAILTSYDLENYKDIAFKHGVKDFINKSVEIEELINRLISVMKGNCWEREKVIIDPLTSREIEVLEELISGDSKKAIAKKLYISERTLYNHIANIYAKLEVNNVIEAYNKAMEIGYIDPVM